MKYSHTEIFTEVGKFSVVTFLVTLFVYFAIWKYKRRNFEKMASKFPGPFAYPIFGNALELLGTPNVVFDKANNMFLTYGSPMRVWIGPHLMIVVSKPDDVQIILSSTHALAKNAFFAKLFKDTLGDGLVTAKVSKWKKNRRIIAPAFNTKFLSQFLPTFSKKNREMMENLRRFADTGKSFDLWPHIQVTFLSILSANMLGVDLDPDDKDVVEFADGLVESLSESSIRMYRPWLHFDLIYEIISYMKGTNGISKLIQKLPNEVIQKRKKAYEEQKKDNSFFEPDNIRKTFLDTLLDLNESGANFSDKNLKDEVITMMIGGSDTGSVAVSYTLLMLAMHPNIQEKLYEEVNSVICKNSFCEDLWAEQLNEMTYLDQCLKETLRLFPPFPLIIRMAERDIQISDNFIIPAGANILIAPLATHRDSSQYPDPFTWNPDNFSPENQLKRHKYSFIPFSAGPRGCIGSRYAMLSTKIAIATTILYYKLETEIKMEDLKLKLEMTVRSVNGYPVKIFLRDKFIENIETKKEVILNHPKDMY